MLINVEGKGGEIEEFEITVTGRANGKVSLAVYGMSQELTGHMSFRETDFGPANVRALGWIRFDKSNYSFKKDEATVVKGYVTIPRNEKGTHLAAIMVEEDTGNSSTNVAVKVRYAVILNINIGNAPRRMITAFADPRLLEVDGRTIVEASFSNQNSFMGLLDSQLQIRDEQRRLIARVPLKTESAWQRGDARARVYPGATVKIYAALETPLPTGDYSILARNSFNGRAQPIYRTSIAFQSNIKEKLFRDLSFLAQQKFAVKQRSSGISLTQIALTNPSSDDVVILLPEPGSNQSIGVHQYEFIPREIVLKPRMTRKVMLKQKHSKDYPYQGDEFVIAAVADDGKRLSQKLFTYPATGEE
jgi:hypothetical protein